MAIINSATFTVRPSVKSDMKDPIHQTIPSDVFCPGRTEADPYMVPNDLQELIRRIQRLFFSSSLADVALWLGPYMSISGKTSHCTRTKTVWKCRQITTTTTTHNPARRPANPPARLAFRQEKQQTRQTKGAGAQTKTTTKEICQRTQWFDHCIILKNMRK